MRKLSSIIAVIAIGVSLTGCQQQQPYVAPQAVTPTVAATCINNAGIVVDDQWCDANYIAQQRQMAIQQNNQALLSQLLLYHMIWSSTPYSVGVYASPGSYYTYAPRGYVVQSRHTYVTHTTVINNNSSAVNHSYPSTNSVYSGSSRTNTTTVPTHAYSNNSSSTSSSRPSSSSSYSSGRSSSYSSSGSSRSFSSSRR